MNKIPRNFTTILYGVFLIFIMLFILIWWYGKNVNKSVNTSGNNYSNSSSSGNDIVNVKSFGAKGDGKTDDTEAIQKAIDSSNNQIIYFPTGRYYVGSLKIKNNTKLTSLNESLQYSGEASSVVLKAKPNTQAIIDTKNTSGFTIEGITFDGNNKKSSGISGGGYNGIIKNCKIYQCDIGIGKNLKSDYTGYLFTTNIDGCMVDNCNQGVTNIVDSKLNNSYVYSCHIGIMLTGGDNTLIGNKIEWNNQYGIKTKWTSHCVISSNIFDRNGFAGIYFDSSSSSDVLSSNVFRRNGALGKEDSEKAQIVLEGTKNITISGNNTVVDNSQDDKKGALVPEFAVYIINTTNIILSGNDLSGGTVKSVVNINNNGLIKNP